MSWNTAQLRTASTILWESGATFDGYVLLTVTPPAPYTDQGKASFFPMQKLPQRIKVPIREGVINTKTRVPFTTSYEPPNCTYSVLWYDHFDQVLSLPVTITVTADPTTLSVPTLEAP